MSENLEEFYTKLLGIEGPWKVTTIHRDSKKKEVTVSVEYDQDQPYRCPECEAEAKLHDHRKRKWRHLDSCNHKTIIETDVPRVFCEAHGLKQLPVSWAEKHSRFTMEFERAVLIWLQEDSIKTVAENFSLSWDQVDRIMSRAVERGLKRRKKSSPKHIGIDETAFQKRHEYVTVILDKDDDTVIDILEDRKSKTLDNWFVQQEKSDFSRLESVTMDMWDPFIGAVKKNFENADKLIAFDRFHVAGHFAKALDKVRAAEHRELAAESPLTRSKYHWLKNSHNTDNRTKRRREFMDLTRMNLKTARAWRIKEAASELWDFRYMGVAEKHWKRLLGWISRSRLKPVIAVGKMIRRYLWGILNAIRNKVNNSMLEAKNARIQKIKKIACGFRNKKRFKTAILFHLGGLDLMPSPTI
jgi:transposase